MSEHGIDVNHVETDTVAERDITALMKAWRKGRATQTMWSALSEGYITVFSLAVVGAMVISLLVQTQQNAASCDTVGCLSARALLPWALFAAVLALGLMLARLFGPVLASAAEGFWLLDAPLRRRKLLGRRLVTITVLAGVAGAALGALLAALVGSPAATIGAWALATGLAASAVVAFAAAEQGAERTGLVRVGQALAALAATAVMAAVVGIAAGWLPLAASVERSTFIAWVAAAASAVLLAASFALAWSRLHLIRRARLQSGGALVSGMSGAAYAMDLGLMRDILVEREMQAKGHVNPTRGRGTGPMALFWRDVQRVLRQPLPVVIVLASALVPYAVAALGLSRMNPFISGLVLCFLLVATMGSLRVLSRTPGLLRMMPFPTSAVRTAAIGVPAILALVWALLTAPGFAGLLTADAPTGLAGLGTGLLTALITAIAGLLGAMRWTTAKSANYNTPTMATPLGALPPGAVFSLVAGLDMVALVTLPLIFQWPAWISLALAMFIFMLLRGGLNMEELQAEQERQKKAAEQARAEAAKKSAKTEKIKIRR